MGVANEDSFMSFYTTLNGTDTERLQIKSDGESIFTGAVSASGIYYVEAGNSIAFADTGASVNKYSIRHHQNILKLINDTDEVLNISSSNVGIQTIYPPKPLTVEGDISGSGEVYAVSASFGALSNTTNRWNDGSHGNDQFIALTPADFHVVNSTRATLNAISYDDGGSIRAQDAGADYHAIKVIPMGFEAHRGVVYGNSVGDNWTAESGSILDQGTINIRGNTSIGTEGDFISVVTGDGESYVVMIWNPTATSDELDGGKIFIRRTT